MGTYDFDRFKDNGNTYLCKDTKGRQDLDTAKTELKSDIAQVENDIKKALKKRYVIIGDSYLDGYTPDGNVESFGIKLQRLIGAQDEDWIMAHYGGTGFVNTVSGKNYKTLTQEAYNRTTSPETITHVIYAGGYNDSSYSSSDIQNSINDCYNKMHELFPNAIMYLANIACTFKNHEVLLHLHDNVLHAFNHAGGTSNKVTSLGYIGNALHDKGMMASDGMHPNDWGQWIIALALSYKLRGGEYEPVGPYTEFTANSETPNLSKSSVKGYEFYNKDTLSIVISRIDFSVHPNIPTEVGWSVGNVSDTHYVRQSYNTLTSIQTTGIVAYNGGTAFRTCSMEVAVSEGGVFTVKLHTLKKDDSNYEVLNDILFIAFNNTTLRIPLCYA